MFGGHRPPLQLRRAQRTIGDRGMFGSSRIPLQATRNRINEIRDMFGDDRFRGGDLLASESKRLLRDRLQRIDVVKVNALHLVYPWIDVARHRDVDDEKWSINPIIQHRRSTTF